jgi:chemotaxis protein methyltransferase CheR
MHLINISCSEFAIIKRIIFDKIGITLNDNRKEMVRNRLFCRILHYKLDSFSNYIKIIQLSALEMGEFLNRISTNETYFFREQAHFDFLHNLAKESKYLRVWSAASSIGAEAYSIAMTLDHAIEKWDVVGSDINTHVLKIAKTGLYQLPMINKIPQIYKEKYCLLGRNQFADKILVDRKLLENTTFLENNLMKENVMLGKFDVIFIRNVLIYFSDETKIKVIQNILNNLKDGGYLIIGLTDVINDREFKSLRYMNNSIYQKVL